MFGLECDDNAILCDAMLCYAMLCHVMLCRAMLCFYIVGNFQHEGKDEENVGK